MDALCVFRNDVCRVAAELRPDAAVQFSFFWIGNAEKEVYIDIACSHDGRHYRWRPVRFEVGDKISVVTAEVKNVDRPIESFTGEDMDHRMKSTSEVKPARRRRVPIRDIGDLECHINDKRLFSYHLNTDNMMSVEFLWLGDRNGRSLIRVDLYASDSPRDSDIPTVRFGDTVTITSSIC
jgi:hypothetical protein